jgi:tetratricopeptide (TPR) repeat protein
VVDPADSGLVFFKMATAYDELRDLKNSLRCAKLYLNVCRQMGDSVGEALACNNIGVQYQSIGGRKNLSKAISYHSLHLQSGDDLGRFIAYLNLGHAYREMGMPSQSKESTQKALECAQRAYSAFGESIACAQLGQTMRMVGDPEACSNFLEKWLELSESMHDQDSEASAWKALGSLQQDSHKHQDAAECYTHAYELALSRHDVPQTDYARALVGITKGDQELERRMQMAGMNLRREVGH